MRSGAVLCLLLLACGGAQARSYNVTTRPGKPVQVLHEASWDRSCQPTGGPSFSFAPEPEHGTITTRPVSSVIQTCDAGGCECKGHRIAATAVYYTSEASFHGADHFGIASTFPNGTVLNHTATVNVR